MKDDAGKPRLDLIDPYFLEDLGAILEFGARKYAEDDWKSIEPKRFEAAAMRHLNEYRKGYMLDPETAKSHLAHAACNLMFLHYLERRKYVIPAEG